MTLGFFPNPYPDELLYSIFARYVDRVRFPSRRGINLELHGSPTGGADIQLASHLDYLLTNLPPNTYYTADRIIDSHTLFNLYKPFLPLHRVKRIKEEMRVGNGNAFFSLAGIGASSISYDEHLRYCSLCAEMDKKSFGERYWHRMHQVPGINVCARHQVQLQTSSIWIRNKSGTTAYITAERALSSSWITSSRPRKVRNKTLLRIIRDFEWLLCQPGLELGFELIHARYLELLLNQGLATYNGRCRGRELISALNDCYKPEILKSLHCEVDASKPSTWPIRIINDLLREKSHHPLRHLLLMGMLGHSAESFFAGCTEGLSRRVMTVLNPFGEGPWPCLNPTCKSFRRKMIKTCHLTHQNYAARRKSPDHCLVATFSCACGFTYCRRELDLPTLGPYDYSFFRSFGHVWDATLARLWVDRSVSLKQVAKSLGTNIHTIKRQAVRLRLVFPRPGTNSFKTCLSPEAKRHLKQKYSNHEKRLLMNRKKWLAIIKRHPDVTHRWLRQNKLYSIYLWLRKHDTDWLKNHRPHPYVRTTPARRVDWQERDAHLVGKIKCVMASIKDSIQRPVRITRGFIATLIQEGQWLNYLSRLPQTAEMLSEVVETREAFAVRRLHWAADFFRSEKISPSRSTLLARAGVEGFVWRTPSMKRIFEKVWESLQHPQTTSRMEAA